MKKITCSTFVIPLAATDRRGRNNKIELNFIVALIKVREMNRGIEEYAKKTG